MREGKPSSTAILIANTIAFLSFDPQLGQLIPPGMAEMNGWFIERTRTVRWLGGVVDRRWFRALIFTAERWHVPGLMLHALLRKLYLEALTRQCLLQGVQQVVVLGAGFDTLALRLHRDFSQVVFIEVDHPQTQHVKRQSLTGRGLPRANLQLLPVDFTCQTLAQSLLACPLYDAKRDALFIAEGVLMYLEPGDIDGLFAFVREHSGRGSKFAFTFMSRWGKRIGFAKNSPLADFWLRTRGEPLRWGATPEEIPAFLAERGFESQELAGPQTFRQRYLEPCGLFHVPLAQGEYVCLAQRQRFTDRGKTPQGAVAQSGDEPRPRQPGFEL